LNSISHEIEKNSSCSFRHRTGLNGLFERIFEAAKLAQSIDAKRETARAKHCDGLFFFKSGERDLTD